MMEEFLRKICMFSALSEESLKWISTRLKTKHIDKGQVAFREGDEPESLYIIKDGSCILYRTVNGEDISAYRAGSGEVTGVLSAFSNEKHTLTMKAETDVRDDLVELQHTDPSVPGKMLGCVMEKLRRSRTFLGVHKRGPEDFSVAVFDAKPYDVKYLNEAMSRNQQSANIKLSYLQTTLSFDTANLALGHDAVCVFVNDKCDAQVLSMLKDNDIELVVARAAGTNNIDITQANDLGFSATNVPEYSPHAVAEHACALILSLNRNIHHAYIRVREQNFSLNGLMGFDLYNCTIGVLGTGKIGECFAKIMLGFGCHVVAFDAYHKQELTSLPNFKYLDKIENVLECSDVISLHMPLTDKSHHIINAEKLSRVKHGAMLINTSRGGLVDTAALVDAIKSGQIGSAGLDVYEEESGIFFEDKSQDIALDDVLARLLVFPNVVITSHQAYFTKQAMTSIADTTISSIIEYRNGKRRKELTRSCL